MERDHERDDAIHSVRGIMLGLVLGTLMWMFIFTGVELFFNMF